MKLTGPNIPKYPWRISSPTLPSRPSIETAKELIVEGGAGTGGAGITGVEVTNVCMKKKEIAKAKAKAIKW